MYSQRLRDFAEYKVFHSRKVPFERREPVGVPLISQMCDKLTELFYAKAHLRPIALLVADQQSNRAAAASLLSGVQQRGIAASIARAHHKVE